MKYYYETLPKGALWALTLIYLGIAAFSFYTALGRGPNWLLGIYAFAAMRGLFYGERLHRALRKGRQ